MKALEDVGLISLSSLTQPSALHVPNVAYDLLSITKVTKARNYYVTFSPFNVFFRILPEGKGLAVLKKEKGCITHVLKCMEVFKFMLLRHFRI
ncbi:hypothetical protein CK203_043074 [Vitis vinifera]|uniref:Uncharacterized protein n=1 Tax=Vitis vinifera TaxID=29760 RepID=A0A438GXA9_VITVI|nr:hypothetical protein CK203_043074 [Vitis vinifera]